jgi:Fic family protein
MPLRFTVSEAARLLRLKYHTAWAQIDQWLYYGWLKKGPITPDLKPGKQAYIKVAETVVLPKTKSEIRAEAARARKQKDVARMAATVANLPTTFTVKQAERAWGIGRNAARERLRCYEKHGLLTHAGFERTSVGVQALWRRSGNE